MLRGVYDVAVFAFVDQSWASEALCAQTDPEIFFPPPGGSIQAPKNICARCPVRENCLVWALDTNEKFGVWGGRSERERRKLRTKHTPRSTP